ncbi:MAG: GtrA family protein [Patescibacteria group bacterium]
MHTDNDPLHVKIAVRFLVSGGTAAGLLLGILFVLHEIAGLWYVLASTIAFGIAVIASFLLQKFWTFRDNSRHMVHRQFVLFVLLALFNMGANALLIYTFTDIFHVWYIFSQIAASLIVAVWSFFIYRHYIFSRPTEAPVAIHEHA